MRLVGMTEQSSIPTQPRSRRPLVRNRPGPSKLSRNRMEPPIPVIDTQARAATSHGVSVAAESPTPTRLPKNTVPLKRRDEIPTRRPNVVAMARMRSNLPSEA